MRAVTYSAMVFFSSSALVDDDVEWKESSATKTVSTR